MKLTASIRSISFCILHFKQSTNWNRFVRLVKAEVSKMNELEGEDNIFRKQ